MVDQKGASVSLHFDPGDKGPKRVGAILIAVGVLVFAGTLASLPGLLAPPKGYPVEAEVVSVSVVTWEESHTVGSGRSRSTITKTCYGNEYELRFVADGREQEDTLRGRDCSLKEETALKRRRGRKRGSTLEVLYETGKKGVKWPGKRMDVMPQVAGVCITLALFILGGAELYASRAPTRKEREAKLKRIGCIGCLLVAALPVVVFVAVAAAMLWIK